MPDGLPPSDGLLESGFGSPATAQLLSWSARVRWMLHVEAAIALTQAEWGLIPQAAGAAIATACAADDLDLAGLGEAAAAAATPVIPLIAEICARLDDDVRPHLHLGVTSQDLMDTAMVLAVREALEVLEDELVAAAAHCAELARAHRRTVAAGRTLGQHAVPVTMGLRAARWLGALDRRVVALREAGARYCVLQFGGAAGTMGALGPEALSVAEALGARLGLDVPDLPWHAERDRVSDLAGALAGIAQVGAKVAGDIIGLAQTEIGEVAETADGMPTSSAMQHKRNPVNAVAARASANLALGELSVLLSPGAHDFERAAGAWQAEWVALPSTLVRAHGCVERLGRSLVRLEIDVDRARANLDRPPGLVVAGQLTDALALDLGRPAAVSLVAELSATARADERHLRDVARADTRVTEVLEPEGLAVALDPAGSLGSVDSLIDRALASHDSLITGRDG